MLVMSSIIPPRRDTKTTHWGGTLLVHMNISKDNKKFTYTWQGRWLKWNQCCLDFLTLGVLSFHLHHVKFIFRAGVHTSLDRTRQQLTVIIQSPLRCVHTWPVGFCSNKLWCGFPFSLVFLWYVYHASFHHTLETGGTLNLCPILYNWPVPYQKIK